MTNHSSTHIIVGMSGGVDSSVSALLLQQQGYQVSGLFMRNWQEQDENCPATIDYNDAKSVCAKLGIPLHYVNFADRYWDQVFEHFLNEYRAGRTPNPDILCNKEIKFRAFLDYAKLELKADYIATGHYVRKRTEGQQHYLLKGLDDSKDQSYFLYALNQAQLKDSLFPVGELQKSVVREIAKQHGLLTHNKKDSTGICFIGERKFKQFLSEFLPAQPGAIITTEGQIIGRHTGLMYYTIGQRQGIGIGGLKNTGEAPWYVIDKNMEQNQLIVAQGHDHPQLLATTLLCEQCTFIAGDAPSLPLQCEAKIRYRQTAKPCVVELLDSGQYKVEFANPERAITPGQSIVFYQDDICLGGGIIIGKG